MASATTTELELTRYAQQQETPDIEPHRNESIDEPNASSSLPPTDGGKDAWLFLFASFMLEALIWGRSALQFERHLLMLPRFRCILWSLPRVLHYT